MKRRIDVVATYSINVVQSRQRQLAGRKGRPSRSTSIPTLAPLGDRFDDVAFRAARLLFVGYGPIGMYAG